MNELIAHSNSNVYAKDDVLRNKCGDHAADYHPIGSIHIFRGKNIRLVPINLQSLKNHMVYKSLKTTISNVEDTLPNGTQGYQIT